MFDFLTLTESSEIPHSIGIDVFGTDNYLMKVKGSLIYRCNKSSNPKVPFLITSESIGDLSSMSNIDIISLRDINLRFRG